jgi:hypothetical protein
VTDLTWHRRVLVALLLLLAGGRFAQALTFDDLLAEADLNYRQPNGFGTVEARVNEVLSYEQAVRRQDNALEIRYAIRPLFRMTIQYEDPHNAAPDPNHLFPRMFQSLVDNLSQGGHAPATEYPIEQAKGYFNADWAAAAVLDVSPKFSQEFSQALVVALHKNKSADAYMVFLFDDYEKVKVAIKSNLNSLKFR